MCEITSRAAHNMCIPFQECKALGFDTIELNAGSLNLPEEALLRLVRLIKSSGLRAKPMFSVKFDSSDIPASGDRAFGAYIAPVKGKTSGKLNRGLPFQLHCTNCNW
jgi:hypothetical protein